MKFVCDQCKTKYSIDDARVRGKVLKIRCKQCNQIITVREETASRTGSSQSIPAQPSKALEKALDASFGGSDFAEGSDRTMIQSGPAAAAAIAAANAAASASARPAAAAPAEDWFISFDGDQEGPLSLDKMVARIKVETAKGKEAHAWRDGFDSWLAIAEVPEVQRALKAAAPAPQKPPAPRAATGPVPRVAEPVRPAAAQRTPTPSPASSVGRGTGGAPAIPAAAQRSSPTPAIPAAAQRSPAAAPARPFAPSESTMMDMQAPALPVAKSAVVTHSSPAAAAAAAAPVPSIETTPAPLPAAPLAPLVEPAPAAPMMAIRHQSTAPLASERPPRDESVTPLPPPPKHDLVIGEPSAVMRIPTVGANGQAATAPPVVIITGPGSRSAPWLKWALIGGGAVILLLLGTVGYLLFGRKPIEPVVVAERPAAPATAGTPVDDRPPAVVDPGAPPVAPQPAAPVAKGPDPKGAPAPTKHSSGSKPVKGEKLSSSQAELQRLYGDAEKTTPQRELPKVQEERKPQAQVSETQIRDVVTRNKQSLTFCYDRVLKRDNTLKNARVDVEVRIGISGSVTKVNVGDQYAGSEIGTCLTQAIKRWHFPAQDSEYGTSFPLLLQAQ